MSQALFLSVWPFVSGLLGIFLGALLNFYLQYRRDRRLNRETIVAEIATFARECSAAILELYGARSSAGSDIEKWKARAKLESVYGTGLALNTKIFREFRQRRTRAAFHKLLSRFENLREAVDTTDALAANRFELGLRWLHAQARDAISFAASGSGLELIDRKRLVFVGLRRVTPFDKQQLTFDDETLPWLFEIKFAGDELPGEAIQTITRRIGEQLGGKLCGDHDCAPHLVLTNNSPSFDIEVHACCEKFVEQTRDRLGLQNKGQLYMRSA
ncbi:MAG TPA: hypothetical protein VG387_22295 [Rhizomicrobium sp.]|jgi:hypothetical protein|nr:hypothetical protein [Rhizomicrobium sp.]